MKIIFDNFRFVESWLGDLKFVFIMENNVYGDRKIELLQKIYLRNVVILDYKLSFDSRLVEEISSTVSRHIGRKIITPLPLPFPPRITRSIVIVRNRLASDTIVD